MASVLWHVQNNVLTANYQERYSTPKTPEQHLQPQESRHFYFHPTLSRNTSTYSHFSFNASSRALKVYVILCVEMKSHTKALSLPPYTMRTYLISRGDSVPISG